MSEQGRHRQEGAVPAVEAHGRARICLVEDEMAIAEAISFLLEREGWQVELVADGAAAIDAIRRARPDVVILDLMLPGRSGYDILRDIKADPALAGTRVLMLTARGQERDRERAATLGVDRFMTKPFSNTELVGTVRVMLSGPAGEAGG